MSNGYIDSLYNMLINLSEIRGELDPASNKITEEQIAYVKTKIIEAEAKRAIN